MKKAIEIGNEVLQAEKRDLSVEEAECLLPLVYTWLKKIPLTDDVKNMFIYQVFAKRVGFHGIPVDETVPAFIAIVADRPGIAVLYAAAMKSIYERVNRTITLDDVIDAFADGVPTENELHRIWDGQKRRPETSIQSDNSLDMQEAWL